MKSSSDLAYGLPQMAQNAFKPEEIDAGAEQQELERGQKMWNEAGEDAEKYAQANEAKLSSAGTKPPIPPQLNLPSTTHRHAR